MPHSSAVCSWMVRSRQRPGDVFAVEGADGHVRIADVECKKHGYMKVVTSTRQDGGLRPIIFAHPQEARRIEPAGDALQAVTPASPARAFRKRSWKRW